MWSVGCVMFELFNNHRLLVTNSPEDPDCYMKELFATIGVPEGSHKLPGFAKLESFGIEPAGRGMVLKTRDKKARNLLKALLSVDPAQRITAADALNHEYFKCYRLDPVPAAPTLQTTRALPVTRRAPKGMITYHEKNRRKVFAHLEASNQYFELSAGNFFFACDVADAFFATDTIPKKHLNVFVYVCTYLASALRDNVGLAPNHNLEAQVSQEPRALLDMQLKILQALNFDLRLW
jgi:serine/threonine protein kinase